MFSKFDTLEPFKGSQCEVRNENGELVVMGLLTEVDGNKVGIVDRFSKRIRRLDKIPVTLNVLNAKFGFRVLSGSVLLSTDNMLYLHNLKMIARSERRNGYRAPILLSAKVRDYNLNTKGNEEVNVIVTNISLQGLGLKTDKPLSLNKLYYIDFCIDKENYTTLVKPVRVSSNGAEGYEVGCKIDSIKPSISNLTDFILESQRLEVLGIVNR